MLSRGSGACLGLGAKAWHPWQAIFILRRRGHGADDADNVYAAWPAMIDALWSLFFAAAESLRLPGNAVFDIRHDLADLVHVAGVQVIRKFIKGCVGIR